MSISSSSSSSSEESGSAEIRLDPHKFPIAAPREHPKKDWVKICAIIAAVIGAAIAALAVTSMMGMLPTDPLVGTLAKGVTLLVGAAFLLPAAYILFDKWKNS